MESLSQKVDLFGISSEDRKRIMLQFRRQGLSPSQSESRINRILGFVAEGIEGKYSDSQSKKNMLKHFKQEGLSDTEALQKYREIVNMVALGIIESEVETSIKNKKEHEIEGIEVQYNPQTVPLPVALADTKDSVISFIINRGISKNRVLDLYTRLFSDALTVYTETHQTGKPNNVPRYQTSFNEDSDNPVYSVTDFFGQGETLESMGMHVISKGSLAARNGGNISFQRKAERLAAQA